jgi:hypothetical protein
MDPETEAGAAWRSGAGRIPPLCVFAPSAIPIRDTGDFQTGSRFGLRARHDEIVAGAHIVRSIRAGEGGYLLMLGRQRTE